MSSVRKWGGCVEDYIEIHRWFDQSKAHVPDFRHRALRHHTEGIETMERIFGHSITNSDGKVVPSKWLGEQHCIEDFGFIPTPSQWLLCIVAEPWMATGARRLSKELENAAS
jgi:hypothetical protein